MGSNPGGTKIIFIFSGKNFFYYFFLSFVPCIELVILWGMFTNHMDMQKGGEVLKASIINNLAQCGGCVPDCEIGDFWAISCNLGGFV